MWWRIASSSCRYASTTSEGLSAVSGAQSSSATKGARPSSRSEATAACEQKCNAWA